VNGESGFHGPFAGVTHAPCSFVCAIHARPSSAETLEAATAATPNASPTERTIDRAADTETKLSTLFETLLMGSSCSSQSAPPTTKNPPGPECQCTDS
jgi:hypothetical protein